MCFQTKIRENSKIFTNISEIVLIVLNYYNIITFFNSTDVTQTRKHQAETSRNCVCVFFRARKHHIRVYLYIIVLFVLFVLIYIIRTDRAIK